MNPRDHAGFTLVEFIVCLVVIGVLILLVLSGVTGVVNRGGGPRTQTLRNMKQLHLATQQMALDGIVTTNLTRGWPGDIGGSFSNWTAQLLKGNYLSKSDLCECLSAPGVIVSPKDSLTTNHTALLLYAVTENSDGDAVFLSTANFTNSPTGGTLNPSAKPFGDKAFIVFHKAGDGAILLAKQAGRTNSVGSYVPLCH
jgi:prepilin-type N-terminal cleavage/methylation domain-containing protein